MAERLLVTIHGVSSESDGLTDLAQDCWKQVPGLIHEVVFWENFPPHLMTYPSVRNLIYLVVKYRLEALVSRHRQAEITVVAHSFGTLAFVNALMMNIVGFTAHTVVFMGSVVPRNFRWDGWLRSGTIGNVLNIARPFDWIVGMSGWIGGGYSGTRGFIEDAFNHFKLGGHSNYYPDDVEDVSRVIEGNFDYAGVTSFQDWYRQLSWHAKLWYRFLRALRILK